MREAVAFAELHGFATGFTRGGHLVFSRNGAQVFGPGTPRSPRAAVATIAILRAVLRQQAAAR